MKLNKCTIIAEAGVNHNGDFDMAVEMIESAAVAGADVIKFQTISKETGFNFAIQDEDIFQFIENSSFNFGQYKKLKNICNENNITFMSSAADLPAVKLLSRLGVNVFKVSSGNFTNYQLLNSLVKHDKPMILSTGMSTSDEIEETYRFITSLGFPEEKLSFLYCVSEYPANYTNINLSKMTDMILRYPRVKIGFSDHSEGIVSSILARSLGAKIIEKHFTLDKSLEGPDQLFSLNPSELKSLVEGVKHTDQILFDEKKLNSGESISKKKIRRTLYFNKNLLSGHVVSELDFAAKRPFNVQGISPKKFLSVIGKKIVKDVKVNEVVTIDKLC